MDYAIETFELTKRFPVPTSLGRWLRGRQARTGVLAVDRVTLQVREGELFGLLGPNGAGKTTLVKMLCSLILPTSGRARIMGHDLRDDEQVRRVIGLATGDERGFFWRLSGRENLRFFAALYGLPPKQAQRRIDELLDRLGMSSWADQRFDRYSSGQKQRLGIARALLHRPRVLFLDEPTRSLDPTATRHLHELILDELQRREGMTVFFTTHHLEEAELLCDRVAIMHEGRVRACGTLEELQAMLRAQVRYHLRTSPLPAEWARTWPDAWGALAIQEMESGYLAITLTTADGEEGLARLINRITQAGGMVYAVQEERPSLAQIFQHFTREDLADA